MVDKKKPVQNKVFKHYVQPYDFNAVCYVGGLDLYVCAHSQSGLICVFYRKCTAFNQRMLDRIVPKLMEENADANSECLL
jgi:hypothetical protein